MDTYTSLGYCMNGASANRGGNKDHTPHFNSRTDLQAPIVQCMGLRRSPSEAQASPRPTVKSPEVTGEEVEGGVPRQPSGACRQ